MAPKWASLAGKVRKGPTEPPPLKKKSRSRGQEKAKIRQTCPQPGRQGGGKWLPSGQVWQEEQGKSNISDLTCEIIPISKKPTREVQL